MSLIGYQFPDLEDKEDDGNWLNVKIEVSSQRGKWSAIDPALLTDEVEWLIDWLKALSAGNYVVRESGFFEPCLSFCLSPAEGDPDELVVELSYGFAPPWATKGLGEKHQIVFPLKSIDLTAAAQSLENQLRRYPHKG